MDGPLSSKQIMRREVKSASTHTQAMALLFCPSRCGFIIRPFYSFIISFYECFFLSFSALFSAVFSLPLVLPQFTTRAFDKNRKNVKKTQRELSNEAQIFTFRKWKTMKCTKNSLLFSRLSSFSIWLEILFLR